MSELNRRKKLVKFVGYGEKYFYDKPCGNLFFSFLVGIIITIIMRFVFKEDYFLYISLFLIAIVCVIISAYVLIGYEKKKREYIGAKSFNMIFMVLALESIGLRLILRGYNQFIILMILICFISIVAGICYTLFRSFMKSNNNNNSVNGWVLAGTSSGIVFAAFVVRRYMPHLNQDQIKFIMGILLCILGFVFSFGGQGIFKCFICLKYNITNEEIDLSLN